MKSLDLVGRRFGYLTAIRPVGTVPTRITIWECVCDCGNVIVARRNNLVSGNTSSCGCYRPELEKLKSEKTFWSNVLKTESGCWEWQGSINSNGYGTLGGKLAHRVSFIMANGDFRRDLDICHTCDNRKCVNPEHLFAGTRLENMADAVKKNRQAKGLMLPHTKLSEDKVIEIRRLYLLGLGYRKLSRQFGVNPTSIKNVVTYKSWRITNG